VWRFACTRHRLLLLDRCPGCGRVPRARSVRLNVAVEPGRCGLPGPDATMRSCSAARPCGHDLRAAEALPIPVDSPILAAQYALDQLIEQPTAPVTYLGAQDGARAFLDDLKLLATRILHVADDGDLARYAPVAFVARRHERHPDAKPSEQASKRQRNMSVPASSAAVAAAVAAARWLAGLAAEWDARLAAIRRLAETDGSS